MEWPAIYVFGKFFTQYYMEYFPYFLKRDGEDIGGGGKKNPFLIEERVFCGVFKVLEPYQAYFLVSFLRPPAAKPMRPVPSNSMVAGSGTGAAAVLAVMATSFK